MKLKIEGINGDDKLFAQLAPFGVPKVPVDFTLDYRLDTATKVLTVSKIEINLRGQARIGAGAGDGRHPDKTSDAQGKTKDDGRLRTASLDIDDTGLLATVLPAAAKMQGSTPEALVAMATVPLAAFTANQGPATLKALDAVVSFIRIGRSPTARSRSPSSRPRRLAGGPRQDHGAQRAHRPLRPHGRVCRHARRARAGAPAAAAAPPAGGAASAAAMPS